MHISWEFLTTSLIVILIPGTGVLYTIFNGLTKGASASIAASIGCTFGIVPSLLASLGGLAVIFHTSALAFMVLKYLGAVYLLYLAWSVWRSSDLLNLNKDDLAKSDQAQDVKQNNLYSIAYKGLLINALNPKLSIFFLAFLPQFLPQQATQPIAAMITLGLVFMLMTLVVFIGYGLIAHQMSHYLMQSQKISRAIQRIFAGSLAFLGIKLALSSQK